ncbi:histidine kinase [Micromonospora terminaliae]|uniref:Histidine kinase n=1 Tax=Micromonospora terminaliae TaxID=1914461 RepID=A0AAJ2ZHU7_9ACTN|nr:histidine kinase [Micromonospora terminaliae]NES30193.1 histidine kinase [Micromonospora terminaliae]QGL47036.1 histidine kinase [Micromonospora terminaliae]
MKPISYMPSAQESQREDKSPVVARLRAVILGVLFAVQISAILAVPVPPRRLAASLAVVTTLTVLQARHFRETASRPPWQRMGLLAVEGLATYLPLLVVGAAWPGSGGFLAASVLLVIPGRAAWAPLTAVIVSLFAAALTSGLGVRDAGYLAITSLAVGLTIFAMCRLTRTVKQAQGTHTEVVQLAVIRERMRFARDLHDLLGYSLAAITLRAELAGRLMNSDPAKARGELRDVVAMARQAVTEVRQVAQGYRNNSLAQEAAAVASLFASADITARVDLNCGVLPDKVDSVLAMLLRELTTNILRHSSARNCWVTAEQTNGHITLSVVNDGVPRTARTYRDGGGLENLAFRLQAVGGTLSATVRGDGRFHVLAKIATQADAGVGARSRRNRWTSSAPRRPAA